MIVSIRHKGLKRFWEKGDASKLPAAFVPKTRLVLALLDAVQDPTHVNIAIGKVHSLSGDWAGYHALSITRNWRLVFRVGEDGNIYDLDFLDYH
jgi:proteic killer suppression protein